MSLPTSLLPKLCPSQCLCVSTLNHIVVVVCTFSFFPYCLDGCRATLKVAISVRYSSGYQVVVFLPKDSVGLSFFPRSGKGNKGNHPNHREKTLLPRILGEELTETRGFEGDEWLKTGNCPIAKSYQACEQSAAPSWRRSSSLPAGIHYRCSRGNRRGPRAAIARTAYAKNPPPSAPYPQRKLRPDAETRDGVHHRGFNLGQVVGSRGERYRMKAGAMKGRTDVEGDNNFAMAGDLQAQKERTLEETSTWAVAFVCLVLVGISILIEHAIHLLEKLLKRKRKAARRGLEKVKSELMLLGFISLLLTVSQNSISNICVRRRSLPPGVPAASHCLLPPPQSTNVFSLVTRMASSAGASQPRATTSALKGKPSDLILFFIFIFVLAVVHVLYCLTTLTLGSIKMRRWKAWENDTKTQEFQVLPRSGEVPVYKRHLIREAALKHVEQIAIFRLDRVCFFRQFIGSVTKVDYWTLRHGFIKAHLPEGSEARFDFRNSVLLTNTHGARSYRWLPFISLIIVLMIGTKLQVIITQMGLRIEGEVMLSRAFRMPFSWPSLPGLHIVGLKNCFHEHYQDIVIRVAMGVIIQVLCSLRDAAAVRSCDTDGIVDETHNLQ
ncbi:hypothetical protein MLD38_018980 [Melastoma candidum]|uniref:Uncharacterized protein n=1 Tax=Melastoma candidum TaxID=119954 RepID=A0ACB9QW42_9MYRT|nr:hypothetical protein MLD38_018980 [Melastoma candidum]